MMTSNTTFTSCMHDQMLESNRDDVKLEAMRCVTVMTAKGKLTVPRTLFPHIVKNISSKNPELKKLIYLYLTSFADQEPDLALLPVATLQKSLKSPNPLVRSSALKVLTSMRLNILSAILMATLRNSVNDLSPYVRKTVAHAIIKIYRLDPSLRPDLVEYIERLFNDKNSMVLSSAVAAFEVVCPDKLELVHKHYRRFCFILADCNEWGQTLLLDLLKRYVIKANRQPSNIKMSDQSLSDQDPKVLLRSAKPLVHSNNSAVVMAVIKLFIAIANFNEVRSTITKPLIRLLYSHREIQLIVLNMIEDLTNLKDPNSSSSDAQDTHADGASIGRAEKDIESEKNSVNKLDKTPTEVEQEVLDVLIHDECIPEQTVTKDGYIAFEENNESEPYNSTEQDGANLESDTYENTGDSAGPSTAQDTPKSNEHTENNKEIVVESEEESEEDEESDEEESGEDESDDEESEESEEDGEETGKASSASDSDKDSDGKKLSEHDSIIFQSNNDPNAYRDVFRPYIKSFYVKHNDCTQIRLAKLRILTNLSSSVNVALILRELQAYIATYVDDKEFVSAAIHAIGRCAIIVNEVAHTCLNGLTNLLSNNNEHVVSEAIVVLRSQIINQKPARIRRQNSVNSLNDRDDKEMVRDMKIGEKDNDAITLTENSHDAYRQEKERNEREDDDEDETTATDDKIVSMVIKQVTKLLPSVTAPQARATILWILAEFCDKNHTAAKCAPNVLRSVAKTFPQEDNFVKLQSLTLASKFLLSLDKEKKAELYHKVQLLTGYLFSLAKYDINHDVRDRGRFLKKLLDDEKTCAKVLRGIDCQQRRDVIKAA